MMQIFVQQCKWGRETGGKETEAIEIHIFENVGSKIWK